MTRALILALALAGPVAAQEPPETSEAPSQRPAELSADGATDAQAEPVAPPAAVAGETTEGTDAPGTAPLRDLLDADAEAHAACLAALDALGARYAALDPIVPADDAECGIQRPLEVSGVLDGVALKPAATLRCETARALGEWARDFVLPAADRLGRGTVTALQGGPGYTCRRRNNRPDGKLSQHAFGNAYDVLGFRFSEGEPLAIMPRARDGTMEEGFQDAVRASACLEFTTVIGPGSDDYHDDHLHLDVVERRAGFRLCEQGRSEGD